MDRLLAWPVVVPCHKEKAAGMKNGLVSGLTIEETYVTTLDMRARQLSSDVFSTPSMISLMEKTCVDLVTPYLDEGEQTVGFHVDVMHLAPTKIGQSITIAVELLELKNKKFKFGVSAVNDQGVKIGKGFHRRALIDVKRFTGGS
jgi:fluoroacetyl-CoA thioesterase